MKDDELAESASQCQELPELENDIPTLGDGPEFSARNCGHFRCYRLRTATAEKGFVKGSISVPQGSKTSL
jgi:hypothetical protein